MNTSDRYTVVGTTHSGARMELTHAVDRAQAEYWARRYKLLLKSFKTIEVMDNG